MELSSLVESLLVPRNGIGVPNASWSSLWALFGGKSPPPSVVTGTEDGRILFFQMDGGEINCFSAHGGPVVGVSWSSNAALLGTSS